MLQDVIYYPSPALSIINRILFKSQNDFLSQSSLLAYELIGLFLPRGKYTVVQNKGPFNNFQQIINKKGNEIPVSIILAR